MNENPQAAGQGSYRSYIVGFVSSLILTVTAYLLVVHHSLSRRILIGAIVALALTQFIAQMLCFLHLGRETKPRWKLAVFCGMVMVVAILVFGSLWIMSNLNYRMTPGQILQYMNNQGDGI